MDNYDIYNGAFDSAGKDILGFLGGYTGTSGNLWTGLGNKITGNLDWQRTQATNAFNAQQAQIQRDWEERMSNTSHQREIEDLRKSGINPYMTLGAGASSPVGSSASGSMPLTAGRGNSGSILASAILSAFTRSKISDKMLNAKNLETWAKLVPTAETLTYVNPKGEITGQVIKEISKIL